MKTKFVMDFVEAINTTNINKIVELMANDHIFIDSQGKKVVGKNNLKQAWLGYFELFPDYKIEITDTLENESLVVILGYASGSYKNLRKNYWKIPAAWKAVVENDKIKLWQVFADNSVVVEIIMKNN